VKTERFLATAEDAEQRVDVVVAKRLSLGRAKVKALFDAGKVRVGNKKAKKGDVLAAGHAVAVDLPEDRPALVPEPDAPLKVLHEDAALVFIDKPARVPSHPLNPSL
jgi:23S rRNA pseudouridine1911/1915/1917 synthase